MKNTELNAAHQKALSNFYQYLVFERRLSENSVEAYQRDLIKFFQFLESNSADYNQPSLKLFRSFSAFLASLGIDKNSIARIFSGLRSFYHYLIHSEIITDFDPGSIEVPKTQRKLPDVLTITEIDAILSTFDRSTFQGQRDAAIIEVLYGCGLRVSELTNLAMSDLFLHDEIIRVTGKGDKQRFVPIGKSATKQLNLYLNHFRNTIKVQKGQENFVFLGQRGKSLTRVFVFLMVKESAQEAGIRKKVSPHTYRHSYATHMVEAGADLRLVQQLVGHESIATTQIYTHLDDAYLKDIITQFHPRS